MPCIAGTAGGPPAWSTRDGPTRTWPWAWPMPRSCWRRMHRRPPPADRQRMGGVRSLLRHPWVRIAVLLAAMVGLSAGVASTSGRYAVIADARFVDRGAAPAPAWARPCARNRERSYVLPCANVEGRVLWVEGRDPDGGGDRHVVAVAGGHLVIIKFPRGRPVPGVLGHVHVSGLLTHGSHGLREVRADAI